MRKTLLALLAFWSINVIAEDKLPDAVSDTATGRTKASSNPYYKDPAKAIRYLVARSGKNQQRNRFCTIGYKMPQGYSMVWALWEEERTLLLWRGSSDADMRLAGLAMARHSLVLGRDTVPTENDINGSTYLVTVDWWISVADDCRKHGEQYEIAPFRIAPSKTGDPR